MHLALSLAAHPSPSRLLVLSRLSRESRGAASPCMRSLDPRAPAARPAGGPRPRVLKYLSIRILVHLQHIFRGHKIYEPATSGQPLLGTNMY